MRKVFIRGGKAWTRRANNGTNIMKDRVHFLVGEVGAPTFNAFHFVQGATGVTKTAARELRDCGAAGGNKWGEWKGDLSPLHRLSACQRWGP